MALARISVLAKPFVPLFPWVVVAALLSATLAGVHYVMAVPAEDRLVRSEANWAAAKQNLARHHKATQARKDFAHVLTLMPTPRDFTRLPLAISEMAQRDRVTLPSLSYSLEKSDEGLATKAVLQGAVTGQYNDLRRFIYHLEASDRLLLFIEDLSVGRSSDVKKERTGKMITVNIRIATYIHKGSQPGGALRASVE